MPLNDMQIRRAKPEAKAYTLGDGQGLSLRIEPNGSKSWRFRYRYAGKPKMIRPLSARSGCKSTCTVVVEKMAGMTEKYANIVEV